MAMPVLAISLTATTLLMRQTRSAMINVLSDDYIRTARAKGLRERAVVVRHGLRNGLIPVITIFGFQAGLIFSGAVITETVFNIPGMGRLFVESVVEEQDYNVIQNLVMFFAIATLVVNLLVDLSYTLIDPRIRTGRGKPHERRPDARRIGCPRRSRGWGCASAIGTARRARSGASTRATARPSSAPCCCSASG